MCLNVCGEDKGWKTSYSSTFLIAKMLHIDVEQTEIKSRPGLIFKLADHCCRLGQFILGGG